MSSASERKGLFMYVYLVRNKRELPACPMQDVGLSYSCLFILGYGGLRVSF